MEGDQQGQRWTTWFLWKEGVQTAEIHRRLVAVCGECAPSRKTVYNWVDGWKSGRTSTAKGTSSGRKVTVTTPVNSSRVERLIQDNRCITFTELEAATGHARSTLYRIVHEHLKMGKVSARWVPKSLNAAQRQQRKDVSSDLLQRYSQDPEGFMSKLVTGDETWLHYHEPETKAQSMQWKHQGSPTPKKFRTQPSVGKRMATVFWDKDGIILIDWLEPGTTINSESYVTTLRSLRRAIQRKRPGKWAKGVLLQHDNARPHTSRATTTAINELGFQVLPHPPYSPDLAPSDYHLFGALKKPLRGHHFADFQELQDAVRTWVRQTPKKWFAEGIEKLPHRWRKCVVLNGDYVEKVDVSAEA